MTVSPNAIVDDLLPLAAPIDEFTPLPGNPRRGDVEAIARSLHQFGQRKPIVVRRSDGVVEAGNHTLLAAQALGWTTIAAVRVDDDADVARAFALADNRTGDLGEYDEAALVDLIRQVQAAEDEALLLATSYSQSDLDELLARLDRANVASPLAFDELDEGDIDTDHECPKCGYQWSGNGG